MARQNPDRDEAARIRDGLVRLEVERDALQARFAELETRTPVPPDGDLTGGPVTERSPAREKVAMFRSLFRGRGDVFSRRWENERTEKSGYAPACSNEWKPQIGGKPRIKCGSCTNQAFLAVTDEAIVDHLRGRHTLGVYPMPADSTC